MAIRSRTPKQREFEEKHPAAATLLRKADRHDELASLALADHDTKDAEQNFAKAKALRQQAREFLNN